MGNIERLDTKGMCIAIFMNENESSTESALFAFKPAKRVMPKKCSKTPRLRYE